jgi:hypothetical protein
VWTLGRLAYIETLVVRTFMPGEEIRWRTGPTSSMARSAGSWRTPAEPPG